MATPIDSLQSKADALSAGLQNSPTAYAPNTLPTGGDLSRSSQLASVNKQIEDLKSKNLRTTWYGNDVPTTDTAGKPDGLFMGALKGLSKPLNAIMGAGQYALGKGSKGDLAGNINEAMKTGLTAGDILKQYGTPRAVQIPLGFALDVMFDPINWATAGTAALIPRVGTGLVKGAIKEGGIRGGIEAATAGLTSNLGKKAVSTMNVVPWAKKSTAYTDLMEKIGNKAITGAEKYDKILGTDVYDRLGKGVFGMQSGIIGSKVEEALRKTPTGDKIVDFLKYSPATAADVTRLGDKIGQLAKEKGIKDLVGKGSTAQFQTMEDFLTPGAAVTLPDELKKTMDVIIRDSDGVLSPEHFGQVTVLDSKENAKALLDAAGVDYNLKNLNKLYESHAVGKTGVQWYDKAIDKLQSSTVDDLIHFRLGPGRTNELVKNESEKLVKEWNSWQNIWGSTKETAGNIAKGAIEAAKNPLNLKPFEKILDAQKDYLGIFKAAKVPMNVGSHVVAHLGNFFMGSMIGLPVTDAEYIKSVLNANKLVRGKLDAKGIKEMFFNDINSFARFMDENPAQFGQLGLPANEIRGKISTEAKLLGSLGITEDEITKFSKEMMDKFDETLKANPMEEITMETITESQKAAIMKKNDIYSTPSQNLAKDIKEAGGEIRQKDLTGSMIQNEIYSNLLERFKTFVEKESKENPNNYFDKAMNFIVNKLPKSYEQIDQTWKLGTTDFLARVGLNDEQLEQISRTVKIGKEDVVERYTKNGQLLHRLTPDKASEVAQEAYMNYSAMPDVVKVLRALPVVGAPFFSFPYAMAAKTAKTAINNPAIFNKIGFMLNEISGSRSPEEKTAMETKYSSYLKSPTVVKLFGSWNTDVKNFIPYYTMNMLNPSQRTYGDSPREQVLKMLDKFPILQDPIGSVFKDYFIQPWILAGTGQVPQGQFGQPVYPSYDVTGKPIDASLGTKAFYGSRAIAESVVPGSLSYAGIIPGVAGVSPELINMIPSYGARSIANAAEGRSSIGAMTKENAIQKTLKSVLGRTGIPAYTLDTQNVVAPNE